MKHVELARKTKSSSHWTRLAAASLLAVAALAGCGGGSDGAPGAPGATGATGATGAPGQDLTAVVNTLTLSATDWAALTPVATVSSVVINSPPVVSFSVVDGYKRPVVGLTTSQLSFSIAKLVPGVDGSQSKWVSYMVGNATSGAPGRPGTDSVAANLVDNKDGTYQYTFSRDITGPLQTKMAAWFADTANAASPYKKADVMGADGKLLDYVPTLQHRMVLQLSGSVNGGTLANPVNVIYDFIPATGAKVAAADVQREVVSIDSCNTCHEKLAFHGGGGRVDTRYCVVCHTDQRKNGYVNVASTDGKFPALKETATVNTTTGITSYTYARLDGIANNYVYDNEVAGNFTTLVHKIHNGSALVKQNYHYAGIAFNNKAYSMLDNGQKMCSTCHDNTKAKQADNWSTQPSRIACGSCHDGINFAEGTGKTLAQAAAGTNPGTGHANINLKQTSDTACAICHTSDSTKVYHRTENVTKHNPTITAGLKTFTYDIKSVAVNDTTKDVTIKFKISAATADANGVLGAASPVTTLSGATATNPLSGFTGAPSFLLAYTTALDSVDYDNAGNKQAQAISVGLATGATTPFTKGLLDPDNTFGFVSQNADDDGYYTATILASGGKAFPPGAKMRAVALQGYFTQVSPAAARHAISVVKAVTDDAVRRKVVDPAKCSNCHEWFEGHGGNRVYETQVCVMCHVPGLATSGRGTTSAQLKAYFRDATKYTAADVRVLTDWGIDRATFGDNANDALKYPVTSNTFKDMIHGIHAGRDRVTPFKDARNRSGTQTLLDFRRMDFPGKLNNCQTCHVAGTFSNVPVSTLPSTYETINLAYSTVKTQINALASLNELNANPYDLVTSPFTASCVSCHDALPAQAHMRLNGGKIQEVRGAGSTLVKAADESCATCHGTGRDKDVAVVHK